MILHYYTPPTVLIIKFSTDYAVLSVCNLAEHESHDTGAIELKIKLLLTSRVMELLMARM